MSPDILQLVQRNMLVIHGKYHFGKQRVENCGSMPGRYTAPQVYIVFATNFQGDGYCFDLHRLDTRGAPRIVLISHELGSVESTEIAKFAKPIAANLKEFLRHFLAGTVDEQCLSDEDVN